MTPTRRLAPAPPAGGVAKFLRWPLGGRALGAATCTAVLLTLAACGSPPVRSPPVRSTPVRAPAPMRVPATVPPELKPPAAAVGAASTAPLAMPYAAAVAARFPDPAVTYRTPGLEPGRTSYTSDAELQGQLRRWVREADPANERSAVRLLEAGRSQRGAPIEALLFSRAEKATAIASQSPGRPLVMFVAQQHGDEPAGAEAMLVLAEQLANGPLQAVLRQVDVLIVPRANPDGALLARRGTANGIDLNRDHLLLRTPEAQALARLQRDHRPMVVVDAHEYTAVGDWPARFGIVRRNDVLLQYAMTANMAEFVGRAAEEWFRKPLLTALAREQLSVDWYHTASLDNQDKSVAMGSIRPDNLRNVNGLRQAVSLLIETRGVGLGRLHLQRRVHSQVVAATSILTSATQRATDLQKLRRFVDNEVGSQACKGTLTIEAETTPSEYGLAGLNPSNGSDRVLSVNWQSALLLRPLRSRSRPCGYWLAADQTEAVLRLRQLGLSVLQVPERMGLRGETYRVVAAAWRDAPPRGATADSGYATPVPVELQPALIDAEPGSYYVPLTQAYANLAVAALEPDTAGSYLAHGLIDRANAVARATSLPPSKLTALP